MRKKLGNSSQTRRSFLKSSSAIAAAALSSTALPNIARVEASGQGTNIKSQAMPTRNLGKTGHKVGIFSLAGRPRSRSRTMKRSRSRSSSARSISV